MNVLSDRLVNLFGALAVGITDRIKKAAFDPTIPGGGETTAAIVVIGHATGLSIDELGRVLGLSHAGTVRLVDRLVAAGFAVRWLCCTNRLNAEVPLSPDRLIPRLP